MLNLAIGVAHVCTLGISYVIKRASGRHCPQCSHKLTSHQRRADGSFVD